MNEARCSRAERATPAVLVVLGALFAGVTLFTHAEPGPPVPAPSASALAGRAAFQRRNCQACHQFYGLGGFLGPDLTNVVRDRGRPHVEHVVVAGFGNMPRFGIDAAEARRITDWLEYVGTTGRWPQKGGAPGGMTR